MRIAYFMPLKPLGHPRPSGDLVMGTGLYNFLQKRGHSIRLASRLRTRLTYLHPWLWPEAVCSRLLTNKWAQDFKPDLWLTYHAYYKAPDILGPACARALGIPYVIFQGAYATKHRRRPLHRVGFYLNRYSLEAADLVICNKKRDYRNCHRLLPEDKLLFIRPGLNPKEFYFSPSQRKQIRAHLAPDNAPLILSTAMMRNDVKSQGVAWLLTALDKLARSGNNFRLAVIGDGPKHTELKKMGEKLLGDRCRFLGRIPRNELFRYYSAADIFAFPGINESFGMAFLEAQSCGLPVVAFNGWGVPEAVENTVTGLLSPPFEEDAFLKNIKTLLANQELRKAMGAHAATRVREEHDENRNLSFFEKALQKLHTNFFLKRLP